MPKRKQDLAVIANANEGEMSSRPTSSFSTALKEFAFTGGSISSGSSRYLATTRAGKLTPALSSRKRTTPTRAASLPKSASFTPRPSTPLSAASSSPPKPKGKRLKHSGYAPPEKYAHLSGIADALCENLICVFVGTNPGLKTAQTGNAYSAPSNLFWKLLHLGGLTPDKKRLPSEHLALPELYSLGNTNLVSRPTKDQAELSATEMEGSVPILEGKIRRYRPEAVCIVGKGIWERIYKVKAGKKLNEFKFGWQGDWRLGADEEGGWEGAKVFVAVSTSGLVAGYSMQEKIRIMTELGQWVGGRRRQRDETAPRGLPDEVVRKAAWRREEEHRMRAREWEASVKVEEVTMDGVAAEPRAEIKVEAKEEEYSMGVQEWETSVKVKETMVDGVAAGTKAEIKVEVKEKEQKGI